MSKARLKIEDRSRFTILYLLCALIIGFTLGCCIKLAYEASSFKPYTWGDTKPIIVNCYGPEFSALQLERGIKFWHQYGHKIAFYEMNPPKEVCKLKWIDGMIILRKAKKDQLNPNTLALTKRKTSMGHLKSAQIVFQPGSQNLDLIIEHELGHAFGYGHNDTEGHIMHSLHGNMGSFFW